MGGQAFKKAKWIQMAERDRKLELPSPTWPTAPLAGWVTRDDDHLARTVNSLDGVLPVALDESILRFPSAPVHSLQRMHEHHVDLKVPEIFHSYRVLRSAEPEFRQKKVARIFLMHTGLNERDSMGVYYRLASNLIKQQPATVCIVRPFPGHMSRFPFSGFAETPLDRYLWDGSHLFRQFIRHMIETQWFLSVLARRSSYRYASGVNLLAESEDPATSRLETDVLAGQMRDAWVKIHQQSEEALAEVREQQPRAIQPEDPPDVKLFESAISSIKDLLKLDSDYPGKSGEPGSEVEFVMELKPDEKKGPGNDSPEIPRPDIDPPLHVIGYSLGGFTAQSVFMSWPFMISSCCTLLGAGALRELAPSTFAHPEEWQTVLHSLRYELDDRMMSEEIVGPGSVAGIDTEQFTFFKRTFYEVFQQEYRGSIQSRLAAFRKRMLFVVGGKDPIVRPESVINSGPPGGINLLEVGGLGHFLDGNSDDQEENQQRLFWVPEMVALLSRFADGVTRDQAFERMFTMFDDKMEKPIVAKEIFEAELLGVKPSRAPSSATAGLKRLTAAELLSIGPDGALSGASFERCLDDLLVRVASRHSEEDGVLFLLRNEMPTMLLQDGLIRERAAALYHDDFGIVRYCHGVKTRRAMLEENIERICLVLPWNAGQIIKNMDIHRGYPSQAETAGGQVLGHVSNEDAWQMCLTECNKLMQADGGKGIHSIRSFDGNTLLEPGSLTQPLLKIAKDVNGQEEPTRIPSLPDCWVWISREALKFDKHVELNVETGIDKLGREVPELCGGANRSWEPGLLDRLRTGKIRNVPVSRARYNPRFRGSLIVSPKSARSLLVHISLCLALSQSTVNKRLEEVFPVVTAAGDASERPPDATLAPA